MTNLPTSGGSYTRDDKGALKRAVAPTKQKPPRGRTASKGTAPSAQPEQKDADK